MTDSSLLFPKCTFNNGEYTEYRLYQRLLYQNSTIVF